MGRRAYLDDLASASELEFPGISHLRSAEDGEFSFAFRSNNTSLVAHITASVQPDLSDYPDSHDYLIFTSDDSHPCIDKAVEAVSSFRHKTVPQMLSGISKYLLNVTATGKRLDPFNLDSDGDIELPDSQDHDSQTHDETLDLEDDDYDDVDNEDWLLNETMDGVGQTNVPSGHTSHNADHVSLAQARRDFLAAKAAGFKIGVVGRLNKGSSCFVAVSCRIAKLGLSTETMHAWTVDPSEYLLLLIYFPFGYKGIDFILRPDSKTIKHYVDFRVGLSKTYRPKSFEDAQRFFCHGSQQDTPGAHLPKHTVSSTAYDLRQCFISRPLETLMCERLLPIIKYRISLGFSWYGAETYYNENQGMTFSHASSSNEPYKGSDSTNLRLPDLMQADSLLDSKETGHASFPLVAMQFLLRHFARCTDFCLVCHCKIDSAVEAIKPYVCDKTLCLFQYMSLGFGPSMEHEIVNSPLVIDLLIGFCYASVASVRLRTFPTGLGWLVPHPSAHIGRPSKSLVLPDSMHTGILSNSQAQELKNTYVKQTPESPVTYEAKLFRCKMELILGNDVDCPLKKGDWIRWSPADSTDQFHSRVKAIWFPTVALSQPIRRATHFPETVKREKTEAEMDSEKTQDVFFEKHDTSFDDLGDDDKATIMGVLLELMPSVREMRGYILGAQSATLQGWIDRMSPAMTGLLRWIIASNRSCIMQVDEPLLADHDMTGDLPMGVRKSEERVAGMNDWLQFRFAMGSPDKEQRFIDSLHHGNSDFPTLFAWHGSPIFNWHGIIREGLNFNVALHGRAHGNGCYHAQEFTTSMTYTTGAPARLASTISNTQATWPNSELKIDTAIALSEIVNSPEKFTSQKPFYVVQHVDWIQTRYLFARPLAKVLIAKDSPTRDILPQDPTRTPKGPGGYLIQLPMSVLPLSRRRRTLHSSVPQTSSSEPEPPNLKRLRFTSALSALLDKAKNQPVSSEVDERDDASVVTLDEDRIIFYEPDVMQPEALRCPPSSAPKLPAVPVTPFRPGTLGTLPTLPPPTYATSLGAKTLQKAFRTLVTAQNAHVANGSLSELGWWADAKHLETTGNLYQWIVALHSFPLELPLAEDLQKQGGDSVILELRFGANFPFSPPFVRIIRPRFLPFQSGGGGHVTIGGSICMDLLTHSGWSAVMTIEAVLLQIRMALLSTDPRPAKLMPARKSTPGSSRLGGGVEASDSGEVYSVDEAVDAFVRACKAHGWEVPADVKAMTASGTFGLGGG